MSDPTSTIYFHNMSCDVSNKILFKPRLKCVLSASNVLVSQPNYILCILKRTVSMRLLF